MKVPASSGSGEALSLARTWPPSHCAVSSARVHGDRALWCHFLGGHYDPIRSGPHPYDPSTSLTSPEDRL